MAGNPFFTSLDPAAVPDPVTPYDGPSDPAGNAKVTPAGNGPAPAPYDISAPQDIAGITAEFNSANHLAGSGVLYPMGPRQSESMAFLDSPQGVGAMSVTSGFPDYERTDISPGGDMENPIQGTGTLPGTTPYPGTVQGGVPQFTAGAGGDGAGIPGVTPEHGDLGPGGMDYPGTIQGGVPMYGTS